MQHARSARSGEEKSAADVYCSKSALDSKETQGVNLWCVDRDEQEERKWKFHPPSTLTLSAPVAAAPVRVQGSLISNQVSFERKKRVQLLSTRERV